MPPATGPPPSLSETDHYWIEIFPPQKGSMLERYIWDVRYKGHLLGLSFSSEQEASIERAIEESTEGASVPDRLTGPPSPAAVRLHPVMGDDSESLSDGSLSPLSPRSPTSMMSDSTLIDSPSPPGNAKGYDQMELLSLDTVASLVLHGDSTTASRTTPAMFRNYRGVWVEARHDLPNDVELEDDIRVADVHQCYTVNLQWYDHPDQKMIDDGYGCSPDYNTFEMIVDTGSSVSWVVGSPCYPLDSERMEPLDRPFPPTPAASVRSSMRDHDYQFDAQMKKCKLLENARPGWVHAPNGQRALATLMRIPQLRVRIGDCYKWIESASQILDLQLSLYFAVAYCMPHELYKMPFSGVLGLDLTAHYTEDQFKGLGNEHVPTFSTALVNQRVLKGPEQGAQAGSASQGIIYYVALRPERFDETQSFIALNRWPCRKRPVWSLNKIAVTHKDWGVNLCYVWFERQVVNPDPPEDKKYEVVLNSAFSFGVNGIQVSLDTGRSLSWLPVDFVKHLRQVIFTESNDCPEGGALNRALDAEGGGINVTQDVARTKPSYYGPVNSDCSSDKWRVGLRFKAADKNSGYVNVYAPLDPFICTMNNRTGKSEGLVCAPAATGADKSPSPYALGINFFQAMFVSMHNIGKGNLSKSFVHMAPQYPEERTTYIPPPISL